jgi:hypothetical protein
MRPLSSPRVASTVVVLIWLALLILLAYAANASTDCPTQAEARARFSGSHLYWHYRDGVRCWDNRRGGTMIRPARRREPATEVPAAIEPPIPAAPDLPAPALQEPRGTALEDDPQWRWIVAARAADQLAAAFGKPSFVGEPIDIKPPANPPPVAPAKPTPRARWAVALLVGTIGAGAGLVSWWRWQASLFRDL